MPWGTGNNKPYGCGPAPCFSKTPWQSLMGILNTKPIKRRKCLHLQVKLLTPLGVPIANGSVVMTLNTAATVIATSSPAPSSYTFNLDASGNFVGNSMAE